MADPIKLFFRFEQNTKNKVRFQEEPPVDDPERPLTVDKLYVTKSAIKALGDPDALHVTIEAP